MNTDAQRDVIPVSSDFKEIARNANVAFWGTGQFSDNWQKAMMEQRPDICLRFFIDTCKQDLDAVPKVYRPENMPCDIDAIIVVSSYLTDIVKQIEQSSIPSRIKLYSGMARMDYDTVEMEQDALRIPRLFGLFLKQKKHGHREKKSSSIEVRNFSNRLVRRKNADTLVAVYDLATSPVTFDFALFLFVAEHVRIEKNKKKLEVAIVPGLEQHKGFRSGLLNYYRKSAGNEEINVDRLHWRKFQIIIPLLRLLPSVSGFYCFSTRKNAEKYLMKFHPYNIHPYNETTRLPGKTCHNVRDLLKIPANSRATLQASEESKRYIDQWILKNKLQNKKLVSITIRKTVYDEQRNSNVEAWMAFAKSLNSEFFVPVFILDTETAFLDNCIEDQFVVFKEAPWNIELRSAIYEKCFVNLMINNGTTALALCNKNVSFISFRQISEGVRVSSEFFLKCQGLNIGDQFPFLTALQKMCWEDDSYENIKKEFELFLKGLQEAIG